MPGNAEWSCFKASLHDHLIFEIFLSVIIPLRASYKSILFYFCKKCYYNLPPSCVFAKPANRGRHSNRCGFVFDNRSYSIRAVAATTYAAHPCQIPHLPIHRGGGIATDVRSVTPLKCPDPLEYFRPVACLCSISHTHCTCSPSFSLLAQSGKHFTM